MNKSLSDACDNYSTYLKQILNPAAQSFTHKVSVNNAQLHDAFGINLFLAHAVDYIQAIRKAAGKEESRTILVKTFDDHYGVAGTRLGARKFELIDAVNNALKHIQLDKGRYGELVEKYGSISFSCLVPNEGRVLCILDGYRFDYSRVVLRPAIDALSGWEFEDRDSVLDFALGNLVISDNSIYGDDEDDPIDQMIAYCNPVCKDCAEHESECQCATFVYNGEKGEFKSNFDGSFDFDGVMSRISGAYRSND